MMSSQLREVDRAFHARWEIKRECSEPLVEMALRALGSHRAWNARSTLCIIATVGKTPIL